MIVALNTLDLSMVGVALPAIRVDLDMSTSALQWVVSGYVLGYGGFLLLGGRAADLLGRRRVFLWGVTVLAVASLLGGLASNGALLIITRFIKGVAAAFTTPAALSVITTTFSEGPSRNRALSIFGLFSASGYSLGLVLSGLMTEVNWRWTFVLPAPIALGTLLAGIWLLPTVRAEQRDRRGYDLLGAGVSLVAMLLLVYTVVNAPKVGWLALQTVVGLAAVGVLAIIFVAIESRSRHPLVRLGIFRSGPLTRANLGAIAFFGGFISFQFVVMLYMQSVQGWTPLQTALAFLPSAVIVAVGAPRTGALVDRFGTAPLIVIGFAAHVVAYALCIRVDVDSGYLTSVLPSMILIGIGFMLVYPSLNIQATAGVPNTEQGLAGGLLNTSVQLGSAIGLAAVTAVITTSGDEESAAALLEAFRPALWVVSGIALFGLAVSVVGMVRRSQPTISERHGGEKTVMESVT